LKHTLLPVTLQPAPRLAVALAAVFSLAAGVAVLMIYRNALDSGKPLLSAHNALFIFALIALLFVLLLVLKEAKSSAAITQIQLLSGTTVLVWGGAQPACAQWLAYLRAGNIGWLRLRLDDAHLARPAKSTCTVWLLGNSAVSSAMRRWLTLRSLNPNANPATNPEPTALAGAAAQVRS
jgi:hypothetical protein